MSRKQNIEMRSFILKKATSLFLEKGYDRTTMKDIAQSCDITVPLLQHYYAKKENILVQYFYNVLHEINEYILAKIIPHPSDYKEFATGIYICVEMRLFYYLLTRNNNELMRLYSNILFDSTLLMRGTDFALINLSHIHDIAADPKERRGFFLLNGILSQFVALYLRQNNMTDFDSFLDEALDCYLSFIDVRYEDRKKLHAHIDALVTPENQKAVFRACKNIDLHYIDASFE